MPIFDLYFKIFIIFINSKVIRDRPINKSKALYVGVGILDYDSFQVQVLFVHIRWLLLGWLANSEELIVASQTVDR